MLNLGCGNVPLAGYINHDRWAHSPYVDAVHDLNLRPWPWADSSFECIAAIDVLEHLDDWVCFFDECWRILKEGGQLSVRVPRFDSPNVWLDPTHRRGYMAANFEFLDPDTEWGRKASVYTPYAWRLQSLVDDGNNINAILSRRRYRSDAGGGRDLGAPRGYPKP